MKYDFQDTRAALCLSIYNLRYQDSLKAVLCCRGTVTVTVNLFQCPVVCFHMHTFTFGSELMCMCVVCKNIHMYVCIYVCTLMYGYVYLSQYILKDIHTYIYVCLYVCMLIDKCVYLIKYVSKNTHACIHICKYMPF